MFSVKFDLDVTVTCDKCGEQITFTMPYHDISMSKEELRGEIITDLDYNNWQDCGDIVCKSCKERGKLNV